MNVLIHNKPWKEKIKTLKSKIKDADISKWSWETTASYLGTKIQYRELNLSIILKIFLPF